MKKNLHLRYQYYDGTVQPQSGRGAEMVLQTSFRGKRSRFREPEGQGQCDQDPAENKRRMPHLRALECRPARGKAVGVLVPGG
jgi:hypothetical protein